MANWGKLTPGQRAELVATKVMGWWKTTCTWYDCEGHHQHRIRNFRPTTNIAQAWAVAECMYHKHHFTVEITMFYNAATCGARFWREGHADVRNRHAFSAVAAEAICHAAVLAVEANQK